MFKTVFPLYNNISDLYNSDYLRTDGYINQDIYLQYINRYILPEISIRDTKSGDKILVDPKSLNIDGYKNLKSDVSQGSFVGTYTEFREEVVKNVDPLEICVIFFLSRYPFISQDDKNTRLKVEQGIIQDIDQSSKHSYRYYPFPILHNISICDEDSLRDIYDDPDKNDPPSPSVECFDKKLLIITSKTRGMTLRETIMSGFIEPQEIFKLYLAILIILAEIESGAISGVKHFTHYDLHTDNILVNTDIRRVYSVRLDDKWFELETYEIGIIDFEMSYLLVDVRTMSGDVYIPTGGIQTQDVQVVPRVVETLSRTVRKNEDEIIELYEDLSNQDNVFRYYHPFSDFNKLTVFILSDLSNRIKNDNPPNEAIQNVRDLINSIYIGIAGVKPSTTKFGLPSLSEKSMKVSHDQLMKGVINTMIESSNPMRESILMRKEIV